jgi:SpoVK/Ycf46/Vps4 family AAA+-type ATPase
VECKSSNREVVAREKAQAVKKNGLLELIETTESLDNIGGLDPLKQWLLQRRDAFSQRAAAFGLPTPKGALILGIPGTGKSLTAKATAQVFGMPLLKLDAGRIFAGIAGQSESNLRSVIQTAEAIAPAVLWMDELWFVDLPSQAERQAIWTIQIAKYRRDPKDFDVVQVARATDGRTGSEIENVFIDALFTGFEMN